MSSGVQLSGDEMLNKKVLSSRRNVRNDETVCRETGRVFHARTAATGNARSPRLDRLVAGTDKVDVEPDLSSCLDPPALYCRRRKWLLVTSPKVHWSEGSIVRKGTGPNSNPNRNPIPNPKVVFDLRNKETLSFSYVHAVRPFRNSGTILLSGTQLKPIP